MPHFVNHERGERLRVQNVQGSSGRENRRPEVEPHEGGVDDDRPDRDAPFRPL
jgi:hypothetical protein